MLYLLAQDFRLAINISGGTVSNNIHLCGYGKSIIEKGVNLVLSGTAQVNNIYGHTWDPSQNGTIKNGLSITVKDNAKVLGTIDGCAASHIEGGRTLIFSEYQGETIDATIVNMDTIKFQQTVKLYLQTHLMSMLSL